MERVTFLVEATGDRLSCLLNPETVVVRRQAGLFQRRSIGGLVRRPGLADDPLLFTGGGTTELTLDLLFDVSLAGSTIQTTDVRVLTRPFWDLTENTEVEGGYGRPPLVRFLWGKAWNVPAVVAAAAERLEQFDQSGAPRRSWMRLRLLRVAEPGAPVEGGEVAPELDQTLDLHPVEGAGSEIAAPPGAEAAAAPEPSVVAGGQRLDELAAKYFGDPSLWREIAEANGIVDPLQLTPGTVLRIPKLKTGGPA